MIPPSLRSPSSHLPVVVETSPGWRWFLHRDGGQSALDRWLDWEAHPERVEERILEEHRSRRAVLLSDDEHALFCKRIRARDPADLVRESFRAGEWLGRTGGVVEVERAWHLREKLGRGPRVLGLGERVVLGLVREQVLLYDALVEHDGLRERLTAAESVPERMELIGRALDLVEELDRSGLTHLDYHAGNVMVSHTSPELDCVVDLSQLTEVSEHRDVLLAFVLGHFFEHRLERFVDRDVYLPYAEARLMRLVGDRHAKLQALVEAMHYFASRTVARRRRHRLAKVGLAGMPVLAWQIRRWAARHGRASAVTSARGA